MKLHHPLSVALIAGTLATLASFFLNAGAQDKSDFTPERSLESAIFAGGCFWCVESDFDKLDGVVETVSGYTGGESIDPTYKSHAKDKHLEAVKVIYDPALVSYDELVNYFIRHIDPTDAGGQFCDRGHSYTTAIFVDTPKERQIAEAAFADVVAADLLAAPIVTAIRDEAAFYPAEDYHQDYYLKNATRYKFYRKSCGRDEKVREVWQRDTQS